MTLSTASIGRLAMIPVMATLVASGACANHAGAHVASAEASQVQPAHEGMSDDSRSWNRSSADHSTEKVAQSQSKPAPRPEPKPARYVPAAQSGSSYASGGNTMAFPTGDRRTSALLVEKVMPNEVMAGQPFDYIIKVTNISKLTLDDVTLSDSFDRGLNIKGSTPKMKSFQNGAAMWDLGSLEPGEVAVITMQADATSEGSVTSCANVSYATALCSTLNIVKPRLILTKSVTPESLLCGAIEYRYTVKNEGTGVARNIRITDELASGVLTSAGNSQLTTTIASLAPGESKSFRGTVEAQRTGRFSSRASASADGGLSAQSDSPTTIVNQPVLKITEKAPAKRFIGRNATFEITVTNTGDAVASNTTLQATMPAGAKTVRMSDNGRRSGANGVWSLGDLAPGKSRTVSFDISAAEAGTFTSNAQVTAECADPASASAQTVYAGIPAILLEVVDVNDPVEVGSQTTYIVTATNQGSANANNVKIVCTLPASQRYVNSTGTTRGDVRGTTLTFAPVRSIAPGQKAQWKVVIEAGSSDDARFKVSMTSDELTRPVEETEATNQYQ